MATCPKCRTPLLPDDELCRRCGASKTDAPIYAPIRANKPTNPMYYIMAAVGLLVLFVYFATHYVMTGKGENRYNPWARER